MISKDHVFKGMYKAGGGGIINLICHATLQDYEIKGSCDFMGGSSLYTTFLPGLMAIGIVVLEMFLIYHVTHRVHWGITTSFLPSPFLNLQTVQALLFRQSPLYIGFFMKPPLKSDFSGKPHNIKIFYPTPPSHLLKF